MVFYLLQMRNYILHILLFFAAVPLLNAQKILLKPNDKHEYIKAGQGVLQDSTSSDSIKSITLRSNKRKKHEKKKHKGNKRAEKIAQFEINKNIPDVKRGNISNINYLTDSLKNIQLENRGALTKIDHLKSIDLDSNKTDQIKEIVNSKVITGLEEGKLGKLDGVKEFTQIKEITERVKSVNIDSLNIDKAINDQVNKTEYGKEINKLDSSNPLKDLKSDTEQLTEQAKSLQDQEQMRRYAKEKASKLASTDMSNYIPQIQAAQQKFTKYKKKVEWFKEGDSKEGNSLKETPLKERFQFGGNIQVPSLSPFSLVAAPYISYKINRKISSGISLTYKFNLENQKLLSVNEGGSEYGYRVFSDYKLIKSWYAHFEFEQLNKLIKPKDSEVIQTQHIVNGYIGAGRQIEVYKGWKLNVTLLCNLLNKDLKYLNPNAFQIRFGILK